MSVRLLAAAGLCLFVCLSVGSSRFVSVCLFVCSSVGSSRFVSVCLSVYYFFIYLSMCLSMCDCPIRFLELLLRRF